MNRRASIDLEKSENSDSWKMWRLYLGNHKHTLKLENKLCGNITKGKQEKLS